MSDKKNVYGEGNYEATRQYNESTRQYLKTADVEQAARDAAPRTPAEEQEMSAAEKEGLSRAKTKPAPAGIPAKKRPKAGATKRK